jgi:hypothetical protein
MLRLPADFTSPVLEHAPQSWTRVESVEVGFVEVCGPHTTGVVIRERFDTAPTPDSDAQRSGRTGSELKDAAIANEVPFIKDLETDRLPLLTGEPEHDGRYAETALARAVSLPLTADMLEDNQRRERLVREAIRVQVNAAKTFPPYFAFKSLDDQWLTVNLLCIDTARLLAPLTAMSAWISVPLSALRDGTLLTAIPLYARRLARGAEIVITVGELNHKLALDDIVAYFDVLAACVDHGLRPLPDRIDELSVPAAALFAVGSILGTSRYRTAGDPYVFKTEKRRTPLVKYHVARQGLKLRVVLARKRRGRKSIPPCADRDCAALKTDNANPRRTLRLHNAHDVLNEIVRARALGARAYVNGLQNNRYAFLRKIGQAIVVANARREAA